LTSAPAETGGGRTRRSYSTPARACGRRSGSSNEGSLLNPSSRAAQFSKTTRRGDGSRRLYQLLPLGSQKGPLVLRGPARSAAGRPVRAPRYEAALFVVRSKSDREV